MDDKYVQLTRHNNNIGVFTDTLNEYEINIYTNLNL